MERTFPLQPCLQLPWIFFRELGVMRSISTILFNCVYTILRQKDNEK